MFCIERLYRTLARYYGCNAALASMFSCAASTIERRMNGVSAIDVRDVYKLEDTLQAYPLSLSRAVSALQSLQFNSDKDVSDAASDAISALSEIKALDPRQFDTPE